MQKLPFIILAHEDARHKSARIHIPSAKADWLFSVSLDKATMQVTNGQPENASKKKDDSAKRKTPPRQVVEIFNQLQPKAVQMLCGTDLLLNDSRTPSHVAH